MTSKLVCFDLRPLQIGHENRGIGMVARSILENLPNDDTRYLFYIFEDHNPIKKLGIKVGTNNYELVKTPTLNHAVKKPRDFIDGLRITYHNFAPLKKYAPDVFIQFDIALGIPKWRRTKTYTVGYDLIPLLMQSDYLPSPLKSLKFDPKSLINVPRRQLATIFIRPRLARHVVGLILKSLRSLLRSAYHLGRYKHALSLYKKVDGVLCISKATRKSFKDLLGIKEEKLFDLPLAAVASDVEPSSTVVDKIKKPYIFYIGGTDDRKRVQDIVYAYNIARGRGADIRLVLAGNELKKLDLIPNLVLRHAIFTSPYREDIILAGFVSDAEKLDLYKNALAFVFASAYEGFGLPILEAAEMDCPVIAYNNSSISELASNDSAMLVETGDFVGIANALEELFYDPTKATRLTESAKGVANGYTWKKTVDRLTKLITR